MFTLHKQPCGSDPGFNREQSSHTSSISGDHRAALPGAGTRLAGWIEAGGVSGGGGDGEA